MNNFLYNAPNRLYLIINGTEYLIREPIGWGSADLAIERTENHGFTFKFPDSDISLGFHDRQVVGNVHAETGQPYQKAKELIDAAVDTFGADVDMRIRLEYRTGGVWERLPEIELDMSAYNNGEFESTLKTDSAVFEKEVKNLLSSKINLYVSQDVNGNTIDRAAQEDVWYHSKALRLTNRGESIGTFNIFNFIGVRGQQNAHGGTTYIVFGFNSITLNEFDGITTLPFSLETNEPTSPVFALPAEGEDGEYVFTPNFRLVGDIDSIAPISATFWYRKNNESEVQFQSETITTPAFTDEFITTPFTLDLVTGDEVYIYGKLSGAFDADLILVNESTLTIVVDTQIPGGFIPSYPILPTLQKAMEILTGQQNALQSDFFADYGHLHFNNGSLIKGGTLSELYAPVISMQDSLDSLDAVFNLGWNFEEDTGTEITTGAMVVGQTVTGSIAGGATIREIFDIDNSIQVYQFTGHFAEGEIITTPTGASRITVLFNPRATLSGQTGTYNPGDTITGSISGATATVSSNPNANDVIINAGSISGSFVVGENISSSSGGNGNLVRLTQNLGLGAYSIGQTVTGQTSGATGEITSVAGAYTHSAQVLSINVTSGTFQAGETVTTSTAASIANTVNTETTNIIRVEDSAHFYNQDAQVIDITDRDISNYREEIANEYIFNEAEFGYPDLRYDEINTVDEFNTKTEYLLASRNLKEKYSKLSKWKTQGYDIEFLRRAALETDTTAFEEDKDIYLVQTTQFSDIQVATFNATNNTITFGVLGQTTAGFMTGISKGRSFSLVVNVGPSENSGTYTFDEGAISGSTVTVNENIPTDSSGSIVTVTNTFITTESNEYFSELSGVISPSTVYNAKLSPARNFLRHAVWLNASQHYKSPTDVVRNTFYDYNGAMVSRLSSADDYYDPDRISLTQNRNFPLTVCNQFNHWVIPKKSEFDVELSFEEFMGILESCKGKGAAPYGYMTHYNWKGQTIDAWILSIKGNPNNNLFRVRTLWWRINGQSPIPPQDFWTDENLDNILQTAGGNTIQWT